MIRRLLAGVLLAALAAGCNTMGRQPRFESARIEPSVLRPGDEAVITVEVKDRYGIVQDVVGVVQEDRRMKFRLRDDGAPPDAEAGDGIWSLDVWPPFLAPAGAFTIEFTGYDRNNNVVVVKTEHGVAPLQRTCRVVITHGDEDPVAPPAEAEPPVTEEPAETEDPSPATS